jgi:transposase
MSAKTFGVPIETKRGRVSALKPIRGHDKLETQVFNLLQTTSLALLKEVKALDKIVASAAHSDRVCRRLMTIPGVGPITALTFRAAVDNPLRFKKSRDVAAYFGLTTRRYQSGNTDISGHISRLGDPSMRAVLYDAACTLLNNCKMQPALRRWGLDLAERKAFKVAAVACARKLACLMHRMWITQQDFRLE